MKQKKSNEKQPKKEKKKSPRAVKTEKPRTRDNNIVKVGRNEAIEDLSDYYDYNMILSQNVKLSMNDVRIRRNNNVLVIGGSGTGKSRFYVKPNVLQMNSSYIITDPAGELIEALGQPLRDNGYEVKIFNLVDMHHSNCYNPFEYIRKGYDESVISMIKALILNTNEGKSGGDPFWEKSETALLQALIFYLIYFEPNAARRNFSTVMELLREANVDIDGRVLDENRQEKSALDVRFDKIRKNDPSHICVRQYDTYKMAAGRTAKSILISCGARLTVFNLPAVANLTNYDSLELDKIGDRKTALFIIISQTDSTYNFLASMMYTQMFDTLYIKGQKNLAEKGNPKLAFPVRCILDEFINIGEIPDFTKKLATMRKYGISASIIIQDVGQLEERYEKTSSSIKGNCDTTVFLGGQDLPTLKEVSEKLGKATITIRNRSHSKNSGSLSFNQSSRALMEPDEIQKMPNEDCIVFVRGEAPFYDQKYEYTKHPRYGTTGDKDKQRMFHFAEMEEYDTNNVNNHMTREQREAMREEQTAIDDMTQGKDRQFKPAKNSDDVLENIVSGMVLDEQDRLNLFSYELARMKNAYEELEMQDMSVPLFNLGPVPVNLLEFLGINFMRDVGKPCIIVANNDTTIKHFSAFLCDPDGRFEGDIASMAGEFMFDRLRVDNGLKFKLQRDNWSDFGKRILAVSQREVEF